MDFDGEFSQNEYLEVVEEAKYIAPEASGLKLCKKGRFPRKNSFERSSEDTSKFTLRLQSGDYDGADYTSEEARNSVFSSTKFINFTKQRAELRHCRNIAHGKTYTLDFDIKISHFSAGSIFQIHAGGSQGSANLTAYQDAIRLIAGQEFNNVAVYRGDWLNEWLSFRIVFRADRADKTFFRFYVNGEETFTTEGRNASYTYSKKGANLSFGLYRGKNPNSAEASYRNIKLSKGDLGQP